jgi:ATP-dependent RNA helicase DeaD
VPDTPAPSAFAALGLPEALCDAVVSLGFDTPTPIQSAAIPHLLDGRDIVGVAGTGTGKTAAFGLPLLAAVDPSLSRVQALVLAPTRELALQVSQAIESFAAPLGGIQVVAVYGGAPYLPQKRAIVAGAQVVVGTPGRVIDHIERGSLRLDKVAFLVLDEADEMLRMGFAEDVEQILSSAASNRQTALFSATMPPAIKSVANKHLRSPLHVDVPTARRASAQVTHRYVWVPHRQKTAALRRVLQVSDTAATIVFVRTRETAEQVGSELIEHGLSAAYLSGDVAQPERERIVERLRSGALDVVVATDVAARGLDVDRIGLVVNLDLPTESEAYVHRTGRTGRAGRDGEAWTFVTPAEQGRLRRIEQALRLSMIESTVPTADQVARARSGRLLDQALAYAGPDLDRYRDTVRDLLADHDPEVLLAKVVAVATKGASSDDPELDLMLSTARHRSDDRHVPNKRNPHGSDKPTYRLPVGHRDNVGPGALVGALTGEGGLRGDQIGKIRMFASFSLVDIPDGLSGDVLERLSRVQVAGRRLSIRPDTGPRRDRPERTHRKVR